MQKRWLQTSQCDNEQVKTLATALGIDPSLAEILNNRGVTTFEQAKSFFRPQLCEMHDPFLMQDMQKAIDRIAKAIATNEKILVYGDYDVDGTTAVTVVYSFFKKLTPHIVYYIPDRHKEGYGISTAGIDYAKTEGFGLIIALDCGIKSLDKVAYANTLGIDFIIGDHHLPGDSLPEAVAVLDPKRTDCNYPFKELSGCGIGLKLVQAYAIHAGMADDLFAEYLDLAMVSVGADIVSMVDENRIIAWYGLKKLNENPCNGLKALMSISGKTENYSIMDVVFLLAPRINAAGRMDHANQAVKMLLCEEQDNALAQSVLINSQNTDRKEFDKSITIEALEQIEADTRLINKKTTVVYKETWNKGVIGIVASRLTEKYYRPTIVLTKSNDLLTGSARSVAGFDLYEALLDCTAHLEQFGGHKFAAGLTLKPENLELFKDRFEAVVAASIKEEHLSPEIKLDAEISLKQIDAKFFRIIGQMGPFGPDNMAPVFVSHNAIIVGSPMLVGTDHLKIKIAQEGSPAFECIAFGMGNFATEIQQNAPFSVCYTIEENNWRDRKTIQLNIKGIKISSQETVGA